jgi:hypothetical protein
MGADGNTTRQPPVKDPDDIHVARLVAKGRSDALTIKTPVQTSQIAPTILWTLGLDPEALQAVRSEKTAVLPGLADAEGNDR